MKKLSYLLILVAVVSHATVLANSLPLPPPNLPAGWQRVQIPEVGTIDIPPTMEVQSGQYGKLNQAMEKSMLDHDAGGTGQITIQQKGQNTFDPVASKSYVRVMVRTNVGSPGDYEPLSSRYEATQDELREISTLFRTQVENQLIEILQWDIPSLELVNGMQAIRITYRRQIQNNPPVRVATYIFQNHDRMHRLTMSYREAERTKWLVDFPAILASFRITNVQEAPTSSTDDPMALVFGEHWVLTLILSAILTWGIGLAPPLLVRFAFMRRPMPKAGAVVFVIVFWFVNILIFTALGSQSKTHAALYLVAMASYYVLRRGAKQRKKVEASPLQQEESTTLNLLLQEEGQKRSSTEGDERYMPPEMRAGSAPSKSESNDSVDPDDKYKPPEMRERGPSERAGDATSEPTHPQESAQPESAGAVGESFSQGQRRTQSSAASAQGMTHQSDTNRKPRGEIIACIAWALLAIQALLLLTMVSMAKDHNGPKTNILSLPLGSIVANIMGLLIGSNVVTIPALLLSLCAWRIRENMAAKWATIAALVLIVLTTTVVVSSEFTLS